MKKPSLEVSPHRAGAGRRGMLMWVVIKQIHQTSCHAAARAPILGGPFDLGRVSFSLD